MAFNRPSLGEILTRVFDDIESAMLGVNARLRRSLERAVGAAQAGVGHLLHAHLSFLEKMLMDDTSEGDYLRRKASVIGVYQLEATRAQITYRFSGDAGAEIPAATEVTINGVTFATDALDEIGGGGTADVPMTAIIGDEGTNGNAEAGTIGQLVSPVDDVDASGEVVSLDVEARDLEDQDDFRDRYLARRRSPPKGGGPGDHVAWAEATEDVNVAKAWEYLRFLGVGSTGVIFTKPNAGNSTGLEVIPTEEEVETVRAHLLTLSADELYVYAPIAQQINPIIRLPVGTPDAVLAAITASLNDLLDPENGTAPGNVVGGTSTTVLISRFREAISQAEGEVNHLLVYPTADIVSSFGHLPVLGTPSYQLNL